MKSDTKPQYEKDAIIECECGNQIKVGSTQKEMKVEMCANCHPFFTGKKKLVDSSGQVEKFKAKMEASQAKREEREKSQEDDGDSEESEEETEE